MSSQEGSAFDDAARGLAELEFDARVALPEAQERFKRAETTIAELMEECELAAEQGRLVGLQADRYRQALETLMEFGKRLMGSETMEERGIGACICESARVIEHG